MKGARRMRHTIGFVLLFVLPPCLKPFVLRRVCGAQVGRHASIGWFATLQGRRIVRGDQASIRALSVIRCDGDVLIGNYAQVSSLTLVYGSASFVVGNHSYVGPQSLINCDEDVRLGHHTAIGARAMVYTHGSWLPYTEGYWVRFGPVTLGDYVWCAAGVFLQPGATVGARSFVNSRSVVTGAIPEDSVVEGSPGRVVADMRRLRRTMTPARVDGAIHEMLQHFADVELRRVRGVEAFEESGGWRVSTARGTWRVIVVGSDPEAVPGEPRSSERVVLVVNRQVWAATNAHPGAILDFTTMTAAVSGDAIGEALVDFLKRYYGVQFELRPKDG